jgi:hypothetical protein
MKEGLAPKHDSELLSHTLPSLLNGCGVANEGCCHLRLIKEERSLGVDIFSHLSREEQKIQNSAKNPKFRERAENSKMMSAELTTQKVKALHCKGKATKHRPFFHSI